MVELARSGLARADRVVQRSDIAPHPSGSVVGLDLQQQLPVLLGIPNVSPPGCAPLL